MGYILTTYFLHTPPPYGHPLYLRGGVLGGIPVPRALPWAGFCRPYRALPYRIPKGMLWVGCYCQPACPHTPPPYGHPLFLRGGVLGRGIQSYKL